MNVNTAQPAEFPLQDVPDDLTPIFDELRGTPFACSGIEEIPGHRVNSTFRASLSRSLPDGCKSIIFKHTRGWDAPWLGIAIDAARCVTEQEVLSKGIVPTVHENGFIVRPPRLLHFIPDHNTQIIENLENTLTLPDFLRSPNGRTISYPFAISLGHAVGVWLGSFHSQIPEQSGLSSARSRGKNMPDQELYVNLYRGIVENHIRQSPHIFESNEESLRQYAAEGIKREMKGRMGLIHGDLGARHILIPSTASTPHQDTLLTPIDWETVHYGCQNQDIGQMVGELCLAKQSEDLAASEWILQGLADGYHALDDESIFHVTVYAGLHILMLLLADGKPDAVKSKRLVVFARDCIIRGTLKDRQWLETTPLRYLLRDLR